MNALRHTLEHKGPILRLNLSGSLVREAELPNFDQLPSGSKRLEMYLSEVNHINSEGIRTWMNWITDVANRHPALEMHYYKCHPTFVNSCSHCLDMVPDKAVVHSLFVPMTNAESQVEETVFLDLDKKKLQDGSRYYR